MRLLALNTEDITRENGVLLITKFSERIPWGTTNQCVVTNNTDLLPSS